mmetsp:Transcript_28106/g.60250  ORF Transcript_28106/g.60250 Transcript_28106/m.60250 type:complete len:147 (-) Transcript_28106:2051-2491(-)
MCNLFQTTLSKALYRELGGETNCVYLTHDHYYRDQSHKSIEERSTTNFDHPDSLETELLVQHLRDLKEGKIVVLPTYDFTTHARTPVTTMVCPKKDNAMTDLLLTRDIPISRWDLACAFVFRRLIHSCSILCSLVAIGPSKKSYHC